MTPEERFKENEKRCIEIAKTASMQYQALLDEGLSQEDARVITAAVIFGGVLLRGQLT